MQRKERPASHRAGLGHARDDPSADTISVANAQGYVLKREGWRVLGCYHDATTMLPRCYRDATTMLPRCYRDAITIEKYGCYVPYHSRVTLQAQRYGYSHCDLCVRGLARQHKHWSRPPC